MNSLTPTESSALPTPHDSLCQKTDNEATLETREITLRINGQEQTFHGGVTFYVRDLIEQLDLAQRRLAVEVNGQIIPKSQHPQTALKTGDCLEIVMAVGGG